MCSLISVAELAPSWRREDVKKNWDTDTFQKNIVFFCLHGHMGIVFLGQRFIFLSYFFKMGGGWTWWTSSYSDMKMQKCRVPWFWPCVLSFPLQKNRDMIGWWISLVVWNIFYFSIHRECHHPNWLSYAFVCFHMLSYFSEAYVNHQVVQYSHEPLKMPWLIDCYILL